MIAPSLFRLTRARSWLFGTGLVLAPLAVIPAVNWKHLAPVQREFPSFWLPSKTRPYNFSLPSNLRQARTTVERFLPVGKPFIGPNIILAIEAGRPIPRTMRMGPFTYSSDFDPEKIDRLHLMTHGAFEKQLRDIDVPIIGLHRDEVFNYIWSVPSFTSQTAEELNRWGSVVSRYFAPAYTDTDFVILARPHLFPLIPPH
jgi:hypothetical protein